MKVLAGTRELLDAFFSVVQAVSSGVVVRVTFEISSRFGDFLVSFRLLSGKALHCCAKVSASGKMRLDDNAHVGQQPANALPTSQLRLHFTEGPSAPASTKVKLNSLAFFSFQQSMVLGFRLMQSMSRFIDFGRRSAGLDQMLQMILSESDLAFSDESVVFPACQELVSSLLEHSTSIRERVLSFVASSPALCAASSLSSRFSSALRTALRAASTAVGSGGLRASHARKRARAWLSSRRAFCSASMASR